MQILLGTTNPSKAARFQTQFKGKGLTFITLRDLHVASSPEERGRNPEENARIKAAHYGRFFDPVITADSALYIRTLPLDDPRQPGTRVRRRPDGYERTDEEMLEDYARLARELGGRMICYYQNAEAVYHRGRVHSFMDTGAINDVYSFYMVDRPHPARHPGWPLDSLSIDRHTGRYFVQENARGALTPEEERIAREHEQARQEFFKRVLGL